MVCGARQKGGERASRRKKGERRERERFCIAPSSPLVGIPIALRGGGERNEWLNEAVEDAPIVTVIQLLEYAL